MIEKKRLSDEQYEFIKGEVADLFVRYNIKCVPVSGFEIAIKLGIKLIPYSSLSIEKKLACLKVSEDGFYCETKGIEKIYYNDDGKSYERQNMTVLHEIGHCVLDHTGNGDDEEAEAKFFAKYAIAPPVLIHKLKIQDPFEIYSSFDISYEAAEYAWWYYQKWLRFHVSCGKYKDYEMKLLSLSVAMA